MAMQIRYEQTLEEAVNSISGVHPDWSRLECFRIGFKEGAEWHAKQSPWISVKERLPEEGKEVIVLYEYVSTLMVQTSFYHKQYEVWSFGDSKIIAWMPIPSFDKILEANRDVLERIKEKGD